MTQFRILALFVAFILALPTQIHGKCDFTANEVENETRIVLVDHHGSRRILNEENVPTHTHLLYVCNDTDIRRVTCKSNKKFSKLLPINECKNPIKAKVLSTDNEQCRAQTYRIGYHVSGKFIEVYRSCYSTTDQRVLSTSHDVFPGSLVIKRPEATFTTDGIITLSDTSSYRAQSISHRFETLLGSDPRYARSKTDIIIDRGHLTPSADFLFPANMRATFKYLNVIPQFSSINRGNWKTIEDFVRRYVNIGGQGRVTTGTCEVLQLPNVRGTMVPMYLLKDNRNPIPKWIYKIIDNPLGKIMFLTYNNIFAQEVPSPNCKEVPCPVQLRDTFESGYTVCCDAQDFEKNVLPNSC